MLIQKIILLVQNVSFCINSWLLPCSDCTSKVLTYHIRTRPAVKLIVVFTSGCYQDESENLNNIAQMQEAGIDVHKVSYSRRLPPAEAF